MATGRIFDRSIFRNDKTLSSVYQAMLPNDIKETFKWVEFLLFNVPMAASAIQKMSGIVITSIDYQSSDLSETNTSDNNSWKNILENDLKIKKRLSEAAYNYKVYANVFASVIPPVNRTLTCPKCFSVTNEKTTVKPKIDKDRSKKTGKLHIEYFCPKCKEKTFSKTTDTSYKDPSKIKIKFWNPASIDISPDTISGDSKYYYTVENDINNMIQNNDVSAIFNVPEVIIISSLLQRKVLFSNREMFHLSKNSLSGIQTSWGIPEMSTAISNFIMLLLAKKANEKIFTDMIFPMRMISPGNSDVSGFIGGNDLVTKFKTMLGNQSADPTGIRFTPFPINAQTVFGDAKSINLLQESSAIEENILSSLGVPIEFIKGGLSYNGSGASIRVLENQLLSLATDINELVQFIADKVASILDKKSINVKLIPFKLLDDIADKQMLISLLQNGKISEKTFTSLFNINNESERRSIQEERKRSIKDDMDAQQYQQDLFGDIQEKARQEEFMENSSSQTINQAAILQEADQLIQRFQQMDDGQKRSEMDRIEKENFVLYSVVKAREEFEGQKARTAASNGGQ